MKTTAKFTAFLLTAAMVSSLTSCVTNVQIYDHAGNYAPGDFETTDAIDTLLIDWNSGSVDVSYHDKNTVSVTETCNVELNDSQKVQTWLDGKTLHIRFSKSGEPFTLNNAEKHLDIKLPKGTELEKLDYDGSSAGASFSEITAKTFDIDTSSGAVQLTGCSADTFEFDASSGKIMLEQKGESDKIAADASSGDITITADKVKEIKTDTSSGKVKINVGEADTVSTNSSSGDAELQFGKMPGSLNMDTSSGDITLCVPKDAGFTANYDTASGSFDSDLKFSKKGDSYIFGDGTNKVDIDTSSGDVTIKTAE